MGAVEDPESGFGCITLRPAYWISKWGGRVGVSCQSGAQLGRAMSVELFAPASSLKPETGGGHWGVRAEKGRGQRAAPCTCVPARQC